MTFHFKNRYWTNKCLPFTSDTSNILIFGSKILRNVTVSSRKSNGQNYWDATHREKQPVASGAYMILQTQRRWCKTRTAAYRRLIVSWINRVLRPFPIPKIFYVISCTPVILAVTVYMILLLRSSIFTSTNDGIIYCRSLGEAHISPVPKIPLLFKLRSKHSMSFEDYHVLLIT